MAKDPKSQVDGIQTEDGIGGRKLIVSGEILAIFEVIKFREYVRLVESGKAP